MFDRPAVEATLRVKASNGIVLDFFVLIGIVAAHFFSGVVEAKAPFLPFVLFAQIVETIEVI